MHNVGSSISVIIPVYNGASFLGAAIESVLAQTLRASEVIVVDDGSTDDSAVIAAHYAPDVRVLSQVNGGCGAARNLGVQHASGTLLAFLDADDLWMPDKLQCQLAAMVGDDTLDAVFGHVELFHDSAINFPLANTPPIYDGIIAGAMLISHAAFRRVGSFATEWRIGEFADWYARAQECGLRQHMLAQVVMRRRLHATNITRADADARAAYLDVLRAALHRRKHISVE